MSRGGPPGATPTLEKAKSFKPSLKRLVRQLGDYRGRMALIVGSIVGSVILTAYAPRVLGDATDELFAGVIGARLPDGITKEQAVAGLRAKGDGTFAAIAPSRISIPRVICFMKCRICAS